jgi:hypothetical protein
MESDSKFYSEFDPDVDMGKEDDVDALDGVDFDGNEDKARDGDNEVEEDEKQEDKEQDDEDEDDGKNTQTIAQGEMVNTWAAEVDTMVDDQQIVVLGQGQEKREHTPQPQPPAPVRRTQTLEPHPRPQTPGTHPLRGLEHLGLVMLQKPRPAVPTLREAETAGNTLDLDKDQQLLIAAAGVDSLSHVPFRNVSLPGVHPDGSVPEVSTSPRVADQAIVVVSGLGSGTCLVRFLCSYQLISGIDYHT